MVLNADDVLLHKPEADGWGEAATEMPERILEQVQVPVSPPSPGSRTPDKGSMIQDTDLPDIQIIQEQITL